MPQPIEGQMAVIDVTAIGHLIQTVSNLATLVGDSAKNLAGYVSLGDVVAVTVDLKTLAGQLSAVGGRMTGRSSWWHGAGIPQTTVDLKLFRLTANGHCYATMQDGLGLQTLITNLAAALMTMESLLTKVSSVSGAVSGLQPLQGHLGHLNNAMGSLTGMMAGVNESVLCQALQDRTERMAADYLGQALLQDWGAYTPP